MTDIPPISLLQTPSSDSTPSTVGDHTGPERRWYAVYTVPQNEKSVVKHLDVRQIESFLPTYESIHRWNNGQRKKVVLPLFPTYLFVRIQAEDRSTVLSAPGIIRIVGNSHGPVALASSDIDFLRSDFCKQRVEPFRELVVGQRVRIKGGPMQGVQGVLVRRKDSLRFVLTLELINQHAAVEVAAEELEPFQA
jgi:transcription antitermination factor NusG